MNCPKGRAKVGSALVAGVRQSVKRSAALRLWSAFALLLFWAGGLWGADTFKCQRPDGTIFFTNDPSQAPSDCRMERVTDLPVIGTIPAATQQEAPAPSAINPDMAQSKSGKTKPFDAFKSEAALLVEKFQDARHRFYRASFAKDQLLARRELADLRVQKNSLLNEIRRSSLSASEQQEIAGLLSSITE